MKRADELMAKHLQLGQSLEIQAEGAQLSARFYPPQRAGKERNAAA